MTKILDEVLKQMPADAEIKDAVFEGANIVLYIKNKEFFLDNKGKIKEIVDNIKKRVEIRLDPSLCMDQEETKKIIEKIINGEAGNLNIIFDPQRSRVIIEADRPGMAIGKNGEILKKIKEQTLWVPLVRRIPPIRSSIVEGIRQVLYDNSDYRRKFLNKVGKRIYEGWTRGRKEEWVRLSFLGAAREVGRSCYLLQTPESKIMLECGFDVAAPVEDSFPYLDAPEFNIQELDAIIITHSHVDHMGTLGYIYKMGYRGPVYMTAPTRDISALLALDFIDIAQKEGRTSLYTTTDVKEMVKHTICLDYGEVSDITPDVRLTFYNAGHTLGSAMAHLHIGNGLHNHLFTGDFNYETSNLLASADTKFPRLESVMMESTYGSKKATIETRKEAEDKLIEIVNKTAERTGKVLMPVLGVGRSQEIMLILERAMREGKIPKMPVYVQGMLWDVTAIHTAYPDFFNNRVKKEIFQTDSNPFLSDIFVKVGSQKEMQEVIEGKGPYLILATSGMLTGGASYVYFKALAENPKNTLILSCYQGVGALGRRIQDGEREIAFIEGGSKRQEMLQVKMEVYSLGGFSGHSNYNQLLEWVSRLDPRPKKVVLVHGEYSRALEMASTIYQQFRMETIAPKNLESIRLR